jgi:hypothetical protein
MKKLKQIRRLLLFFIIALAISGLTAIPIKEELTFLSRFIATDTFLHQWLIKVLSAYTEVHQSYPFLIYGYDWLAFAHFILAVLFIGPYRDPVKNIWVIQFGLIACILVLPAAFIGGYFRGLPLWWQLIDCSFGVVGFAVLFIIYCKIQKIITLTSKTSSYAYTTSKI